MKKIARPILAMALLLLALLYASKALELAVTLQTPTFKVVGLLTGFGLGAWFAWYARALWRDRDSDGLLV